MIAKSLSSSSELGALSHSARSTSANSLPITGGDIELFELVKSSAQLQGLPMSGLKGWLGWSLKVRNRLLLEILCDLCHGLCNRWSHFALFLCSIRWILK